jgi:two-component system, LytTR family, response regulator
MTTQLQCIIIEDLEQDRDLLLKWFADYFPEIQVIGTAVGLHSGLELLEKHSPQILFCDIELDEGSTSFDILAHYKKNSKPITFEVIFMTAHPEQSYYTQAFDYEGIDFIKKPFGHEQLARAIDRARNSIVQNNLNEKYTNLLNLLSQESSISQHLAIHLPNNRLRRLLISDILYVKADTVQSIFHMVSGEKITAIRNLGEYRKILEKHHPFYSISHSVTANLSHKKHYHHKSLTLEFANGQTIHASRQGGQRFKAFLEANPELGIDTIPAEPQNLLERIKTFLGL